MAAGAVDQPGRETLRVVEQDFQQVFGGELLVALAQGQRLRGLHETARAVGEFLEIHSSTPSAHDGAGNSADPVFGGPRSGIMWVHFNRSLKSRIA